MLKIVKVKKTKKGFTLLETLLSCALLVIISTMMMNGFMASINYSHNTSVYAKSAASNYASAMSEMAYYATKAEADKKTAYSALDSKGTDGTLTFTGTGVAGTKLILNTDGELKVKVFEQIDNKTNLHQNLGLSQYKEEYDDKNGSYADNRYSFTYIPGMNKDGSNKHVGEIRIFKKRGTNDYYWGYKKSDGSVVILSTDPINKKAEVDG
ncbi:MAG: type II secretion system GspH family protein [Saccharofermentans sp.]|nr:type II secretion system GspH family protein [Saccharofermentans sp.]